MYEKIDNDILLTLVYLYINLEEKSKKDNIVSEKLKTVSGFVSSYAAIHGGFAYASDYSVSEVGKIIPKKEKAGILMFLLDDVDRSILETLINLYDNLQKRVDEVGLEVAENHLAGLLNRKDLIESYIISYACLINKSFDDNVTISEIKTYMNNEKAIQFTKK